MAALTLENVTYTYRNSPRPAVADVSCEFEAGTLYAVIGPSGSGKSTLLSMLAGLDLPTSGDVLLGTEPIRSLDLDRYRRESVSMIFQAFQLFPLLTVTENVCYPMELVGKKPGEAVPRAKELLSEVGITEEEMRRFPANLSGGQQQRVAIARALASGAKIMLADEPTGNLDVENTVLVMEILKRLASEQGYCVIVVTHDSEVADAADVVFRMTDGRLTRVR